jgi:hypothetical protein
MEATDAEINLIFTERRLVIRRRFLLLSFVSFVVHAFGLSQKIPPEFFPIAFCVYCEL